MSCTIDHLQAGLRVRVVRGFADARGACHEAGEEGRLERLDLDWLRQVFSITWERSGRRETMEFALGATDGPRHGRMREYFALVTGSGASEAGGDATGIGAGPGSGRGVAVALPELRGECVRDPSRWDDAVQRLWALAGRRRFAEAEEQLLALSGEATRDPDADRRWAEVLGRLAEVHADDPGPGVYDWMRDRALRHWYAWGATATSGGEGAARLLEMEPARRRLEALDQRRTRGKGTWRS